MFERFRSQFRPSPEPGLIDHASRAVSDAGHKVRAWIYEKSPWVGAKLDEAAAAVQQLEAQGWSSHFSEFNAALIKPFRVGTSEVVEVVRATARCAAGQDAVVAFSLWNVLCFWLGVVVLVVNLLLPGGSDFAEAIGVAFSYLIAYTLYFVFVRAPQPAWMFASVVFLVLSVSFHVFAGVGGLVLLVPAAMEFAKAAAHAVLLWYAFELYRRSEHAGSQQSAFYRHVQRNAAEML